MHKGDLIGTYRVERELGSGGMGAVYLAQHVVIGRLAAIKVLHAHLGAREEMVQRMFNEARLAALIGHPGLVDVLDVGRLTDGSAYIVMEYLQGETLAALLERSGRLPVELAVTLARQVAVAVGAAHDKGIVHRDLKPENIFVVRDDEAAAGVRARVLDFGIAKLSPGLFTDGGTGMTHTGSMLGTPMYMSPEQCRATSAVDHRADIYSLGCILFELVTGHRVFEIDGIGEVIAAHLHTPPPRPSALEPAVPAWLEHVILRTLAKRPEDRPASMAELAERLGGRPTPSWTPTAELARASPPATTTSRSNGELRTSARRAVTVAPWLLLALAAGAFWLQTRDRDGAEPAGPVVAAPVAAAAPADAGAPDAPPPPPPPPPPVVAIDAGLPDASPPPPSTGRPRPRPRPSPARPQERETMNPFEE